MLDEDKKGQEQPQNDDKEQVMRTDVEGYRSRVVPTRVTPKGKFDVFAERVWVMALSTEQPEPPVTIVPHTKLRMDVDSCHYDSYKTMAQHFKAMTLSCCAT